jgi:hypothetical protein
MKSVLLLTLFSLAHAEPGATHLLCDMHEDFRIYSLVNPNSINRTITEHELSLGGCVTVLDSELASLRRMNERSIVDFYTQRCREEVSRNIRPQRAGTCN